MNKKPIFKRIIQDFFEKSLDETLPRDVVIPADIPKIVSLLGPRRSGKTHVLFDTIKTLRKTVPANRLVYVNFEDDRLFPLKLEDMDELVEGYYEAFPANRDSRVWFFFDEIQEVPNWEKFVRRLLDTENCRIYLTGSSSKLLSRELATSLRGRTLPYEVFPLSFPEFLRFNQIQHPTESSKSASTVLHWFDRWLRQGGYPELVFLPENLHRPTIEEYLDLMVYRDLSERFQIRQPAFLKYVLKFFLQNLANPISIHKVFNDLKSQGYSVAKNTVFEYVSYLEEAFVLFRVDIWHQSARVQSVNPGKFYTIDTAFKHAVSINEDTGRLLENVVFMHLRRQGILPGYFLDKQEVDFYWENGLPVNVCLEYTVPQTREREINGLLSAMKALNVPEGLILTRDRTEEVMLEGKKIQVLPAWQYFLNNKPLEHG